MIFYKCDVHGCGLLSNEYFKRCPSCGVDGTKTQETYSKLTFVGKLPTKPIKDYCPDCNNELDWTYDINDEAKEGEDPRIYGMICSNCEYEKYD